MNFLIEQCHAIDSHVHLSDLRWKDQILELIPEWQSHGIDYFLQAGVNPDEWKAQIKIKDKFPNQVGLCFGLHPWFVANSSEEECEKALDELTGLVPKAHALGEMGLDLRAPHIEGDARERQIDFFRMQMELAQSFNKPCVLHLVRAHEESLRLIQWVGLPERKGMVHAFSGSKELAERYLFEGLWLSIGAAALSPKNQKLLKALEFIPLEKILLESDAPDQPPPGEVQNSPMVVFRVAQLIAEIKKIHIQQVLEQTRSNFGALFL